MQITRKEQLLVQPLFCIVNTGSCLHETLQPRIMYDQWPSAYLLNVKRAPIAIQLDPTAASTHIQLFLISIIVVTLRLVTCRFVCAAPITRVNKPERHLRILRPCALGVSKEVSASFDPAGVCFLALFTDQAQLVRVWTTHCAVGSTWGLFAAVENLGIIFVIFIGCDVANHKPLACPSKTYKFWLGWTSSVEPRLFLHHFEYQVGW